MSQANCPTDTEKHDTQTISTDTVSTRIRCVKCAAPLETENDVCRSCGYYAKLGITVDVDAEWEAAFDPTYQPAEGAQSQTAWEEFCTAVPIWTWPLAISNLAIVALSLVGRLLLPAESIVLEFWGVWQLVLGLALASAMHVLCFIMAASSDTSIGIFDMIISPLKAWLLTFSRLPERLWVVIAGSNGVTLALAAMLIIGGIQWDRLWDWGIKAPPKQSLVSAIASAAANGPSNDDGLEDAVQGFAGQAGGGVTGQANNKLKPNTPPAPRFKADCLIIGFELNNRDEISKLLLASERNGQLMYAGSIKPELDTNENLRLAKRMIEMRTSQPFVKVKLNAQWVQPRFTCRISYAKQEESGRLQDMQWEELLPEIKMPW